MRIVFIQPYEVERHLVNIGIFNRDIATVIQ